MAEEKILSSEQNVNTTPDSVIAGESSPDVINEVVTTSLTLKDRITINTESGGLSQLPFGFDELGGDWVCIKSSNPFEILYLDYKQYKFITPEIVKENYAILSKFWSEKIGLMNTGGNRIAFKNKYGDGIVESSLIKIKQAFDKLSSKTGLEQYYKEINVKRLQNGEENLKETIEDMLLDGVADKFELESRFEKGLKYDLSKEETATIIKRYIDKGNLKPYPDINLNDVSIVNQLLSVTWMTQPKIDEAEKLKKERELLKIQILPGKYATTIEEIGSILFEEPQEAKEIIKEDLLKQVVAQKDIVLARVIGKLSKENKNIDAVYLEIVYKLNSNLPYRFAGKIIAKSTNELCKLIFENDKTLKIGKEEFKKGLIEIWLKETNKKDYDIFIKIIDSAENFELAFLEFIHTFNKSLPYRFAGNHLINNITELCEQINKSANDWDAGKLELFNSAILIWLKTNGNSAIVEKWNKIKGHFLGNENVGLETFLHFLNKKIKFPEIYVDNPILTFSKIQSGSSAKATLVFENTTRGYTAVKISFSKVLEGVSLSSSSIEFNAAHGKNIEQVTLLIDSRFLQKGIKYETNILLNTSVDQELEIPIIFNITFPTNSFIFETSKYAIFVALFFVLIRLIISASYNKYLNSYFDFYLNWNTASNYHKNFSIFGWTFFLFAFVLLIGLYYLIKYLIQKNQIINKRKNNSKNETYINTTNNTKKVPLLFNEFK